MTEADAVPARTGRSPAGRTRGVLRAIAVAACLPYLALKAAWLAGSTVGVPDGSVLLEHRTALTVANGVTFLMDACVIVLALAFTRPWGARLPAWLLAVPAWVATGLLTPIMTGLPVQLLLGALGGSSNGSGASDDGSEPFLHAWVYLVVYGGFLVQGLALGALFALYARDRWGRSWRGRMRDLPRTLPGRTGRRTAVAAAVLALPPLTLRLLWACGATTGLAAGRLADRTSSFRLVEAQHAVFLACAAAAGLLLAFPRAGALPVKVPLFLAWVSSAAAVCWAGWQSVAWLALTDAADRPTTAMQLTYAAQMITGLLVTALAVRLIARRAGGERTGSYLRPSP